MERSWEKDAERSEVCHTTSASPGGPAASAWTVVAEFRKFVKPYFFDLTPFSTHLTGVRPEDVNGAASFEAVFACWKTFMRQFPNNLLVPCGDWDLNIMLPLQLSLSLTRAGGVYVKGQKEVRCK